ncbi:hypothetical protein ABIA33_002350 [Streptacidiphilus sp. MAP12-16]|uniref:hypothetical protein n=1 Tax=Streptacidiphilus sp. MAP12-16 TaxID=3156300 RepID=UPI0035111F20
MHEPDPALPRTLLRHARDRMNLTETPLGRPADDAELRASLKGLLGPDGNDPAEVLRRYSEQIEPSVISCDSQVATPEAFAQTWLRPSVSFRRSQAFTVHEPNTAQRLCLLERSARDLPVEPFNPRRLRAVAKAIPTMTTMSVPNGFVAARAALAGAGVALSFTREVPEPEYVRPRGGSTANAP